MLTGKLNIDLDRRYDSKETAAVLGICRKTLDKYRDSRLITPEIHSTGSIRYTGREIKRFYESTL